jgi:PIN domain nuclease of toxin-antitoxin system
MQSPHRDPFDRLIAAQARIEDLTLVTADAKVAALCATVLW